MTTLNDVWRNISGRVGFFTKETRHEIPAAPGVYAWFVPLWLYDQDLDSFVSTLQSYFLYDPHQKKVAETEVEAHMHWSTLHVNLRRRANTNITDDTREKWNQMCAHPSQKEAFSQALMESTLFLPPLYVGKSDNLQDRYNQHVEGRGCEKNDFHNRFQTFSQQTQLKIRVSDLLFVCVKTEREINKIFREHQLNLLLESVLMRLSMPPFSIK